MLLAGVFSSKHSDVCAVERGAGQLVATALPLACAVGVDSDRREAIGGMADLDYVAILHGV